ncbi:hypothetical protein CLIB1444_05S00474 [[Candida] jaroonii]|uniref:Uncharacterized protein n=1 Tax=[Candida] jaroonii TaxID=467808 RepID=A0ACA9Y7G5_9ASCO|nr:hypothetical protein CLIB1444_05S00474 [[Candida] jaroonii]
MVKRKGGSNIISQFDEVPDKYEDEVLEAYAIITEESGDFYLKQMKKFFNQLSIPKCFTSDIVECVDSFYALQGSLYASTSQKRDIILQMVLAFTITGSITNDDDIIDIIDVDKLIKYSNRLLKYRDNFNVIKETWKLFVSDDNFISAKLSLPELQKIKQSLNLDPSSLNDGLLIDMLSSCKTDEEGTMHNFDLGKSSNGLYINIKDFACILGNLGEFD